MLEQQGLKSALRASPGAGAFWFAMGSPTLVELSLAAQPAAIVIDLQHGLWDRQSVEHALGPMTRGVPTIVRLADGSATSIGEALDAGAAGVLIPLVETAAEAAACVAAAHYPPHGHRSGGGVRPLAGGFAAYVADARARTTVGIMIETAAGVEAAEAIARTPGLDFVFIGTGDLALSLGCYPALDRSHEDACGRVLRACRGANVPCGLFTNSPEEAARRLDEGFALVVVANDIALVSAGFTAAKAGFLTNLGKASA